MALDPQTLKEIAADAYGIAAEDVTDEHTKAVQAMVDKATAATPPAAPAAPPMDLGAAKLAEMQDRAVAAERQLAMLTKAPELDPSEAERHGQTLSRTKSLPDTTAAVLDEDEGEEVFHGFSTTRQWAFDVTRSSHSVTSSRSSVMCLANRS